KNCEASQTISAISFTHPRIRPWRCGLSYPNTTWSSASSHRPAKEWDCTSSRAQNSCARSRTRTRSTITPTPPSRCITGNRRSPSSGLWPPSCVPVTLASKSKCSGEGLGGRLARRNRWHAGPPYHGRLFLEAAPQPEEQINCDLDEGCCVVINH